MKILRGSLLLLLSLSAHAATPLRLEPKKAQTQGLIWTDGVMQIQRPTATPAAKLGYAILKARPNASLHRLLPHGYVQAPLPQTWDLNYYAVPLDSIHKLQDLAAWAHESTGMCGSIEFVQAHNFVAESARILPPIYGAVVFDEAKTWIDAVSLTAMDQTIQTLTALPSRYFKHPEGETAHTTVRQIWEAQMMSGRWALSEESQTLSNQKSVVARLQGITRPDETIIIGAHLDSISSRSVNSSAAASPGADDDASGVAAVTEILRVIEFGQLKFARSIELHAYAAEEVGLVGSKEIAGRYAATGKKIAGMYQIDMAYYSKAGAQGIIHLLQDYTSRDLRRQTIDWIRKYMGPVYKMGFLPRGSASDHKAFHDQGYPTVFPFEDPAGYNPYIHSGSDTPSQFDDGLLQRRITQLALLFTIHQGGLQSLAASYESLKKDVLPEALQQGIKLAIQELNQQYYLAISTALNAATLEFCQIDDGVLPHCTQERVTLEQNASGSARKFFYSATAWPLAAGQKWRVLAYDDNDELIAWRQFSLKSP